MTIMSKKTIRLTESELHNFIKEIVTEIVNSEENERFDLEAKRQAEMKEWMQQEKTLYTDLANYLQRCGVESASVGAFRSGMPNVSVSTNEYHAKKVWRLAEKFAQPRKMYVSDDCYPATTYIKLNKLY
jgi:hypothetical protein